MATALILLAGLLIVQVSLLSSPAAANPTSVTFSYTGSNQSWTVPTGVTSIQVDARGAQGTGAFGGLGGRVVATVPVSAGESLVIDVGGTSGFNGGAGTYNPGGGASDVREGGGALANRIMVAGGGGGQGYYSSPLYGAGGAGGGLTGQAGTVGRCSGAGGGGGSQSAGGAGGANVFSGSASAGTAGSGGNGAPGGYLTNTSGGGGGGGGYYGGGGGGGGNCDNVAHGGGGGGSSYTESTASGVTSYQGYASGNGQVSITYPAAAASVPIATPGSVSFSASGSPVTWTVPGGVSSIEVDARGAQGTNSVGGLGGRVVSTLPVVAGETLVLVVGNSSGFNGGGPSYFGGFPGGGATDIREDGSSLASRILVAGGGGGPGNGETGTGGGGNGGGLSAGAAGNHPCGNGGAGATQSAGGSGGWGYQMSGSGGSLGIGGSGGEGGYTYGEDGGGGGGGGYYGGGGGGGGCQVAWGAYYADAGGGGGSSYTEPTASQVQHSQGWQTGNGAITIAWPSFQAVGGPLAASELMAANPSLNYCPVCHGDPVDTATGSLAETIGDLSVPGRGVPLSLSHSYSWQMAATNGPLGYGWTHSYAMWLNLGSGSPPATATVNQENGTQVGFVVSGTTYAAPPRVLASLVHNGDGSFTFTRRATQIFNFNSAGRLTSEADLNGYTTSLSYNGSGQLTTVTDPAGRTLGMTWTGSHITSVTDTASPARIVTFGYNDGNGNLTDVVDVAGGHTVYTYDSSHRLLTMRAPRYYGDTTTSPSPVTTNHYNSAGQIDWQSDPLGRTTTFSYTDTSTTITDPKGYVEVEQYRYGILVSDTRGSGTAQAATWIYSYDPSTLGLLTVTDPNGNTTSLAYDAGGNLVGTTDALGNTTSHTYNSLNEALTSVDGLGVTTTSTYDAGGNLLTKSTPLVGSSPAATQTVTYTQGDLAHPGDVTSVTDANNHSSTFAYDANGDLASATDPAGDKTTYSNDGIGRRTSMVSPNGNVTGGTPSAHTTTYSYDAFGRLATQTDPLGHIQVHNVYDPNGNLATSTDANSHTTAYTYDPANEMTLTTRADSTTLADGYDLDGNQVTQTDGAAHSTTYAFTNAALPRKATSTTDPNSRTTSYGYDGAGNLVTKQDAGGNCAATPKTGCTTYGYNPGNQQTSINYSDGLTPNVSAVHYDADGQRTSLTDGTGTSSYAFDSLHRLTSSTNGAGATVGYGYDLKGNLTSIAYPGSTGTVSRGFDVADRMHTITDWNSDTTTFNYDADSSMTSQVYPNSTTASFSTDAADRLTTISDEPTSSPSTPFASFGYGRDAANQVSSVTSTGVPADTNSYSYSQINQLKGVSSSSYGYDAADNPVQLTSGAVQSFDSANQLTSASAISLVGTSSASDTGTTNTLTLALPTSTMTGDQILVSVSLPGSASVTPTDGYAVVASASSGGAFTSAKDIVLHHTAASGDSTVTLTFDATYPKAATVAVYRGVDAGTPVDASSTGSASATTTVTSPGVTATMAGDQLALLTASNQASAAGQWGVPSEMGSRVTASAGITITASAADKALGSAGPTGPQTATFSASADLAGVLVALAPAKVTYSYDGRGNRTAMSSAGVITTLTYDQANRLTAYGSAANYVYNADGLRMSKTVTGTVTQQTWDLAEGLALLLVDGSTDYIYGPGGRPLEQISSSALFYYQDQLGSTRVLADVTGTVVASYTYDPYGRLTGSTGSVPNPFGFEGQYTDAESGLIYLRARYYDPATAQFLSRDPLAALTGEPYGYAGDNPLNRWDPSGLLFGIHMGWQDWKTLTDIGSITFSVAATIADATGVGAPVGAALGGISAGFSWASAGLECGYGHDAVGCATAVSFATINTISAGTSAYLGSLGEGAQVAGVAAKELGVGADLLGVGASALQFMEPGGESGSGHLFEAQGQNSISSMASFRSCSSRGPWYV